MASSSKPTFSCAIFNVLVTDEFVNEWIDVCQTHHVHVSEFLLLSCCWTHFGRVLAFKEGLGTRFF